ncbi:hypothetical protein [Variovorax sp. DXTD-1]|uniref:hypothetical protein n=1 Tax=Variovorax sp. DXTD-1 TaxID=2495592 RepID=UPI000F8680D3|nr:hypothetical protein [Variovorax sp. DXTD-1]RST49260.1 hypothetical protein EJI00_14490 [Variovorax sp. DXTD-1]
MRRKLTGFCALLLCSLMLAGCGGGTENAPSGFGVAGLSAKAAVPGGSGSTDGSALAATAARADGKADELFPANRPLARSPFAFARNGQFHVYAANGSRKRLELNFDTKSYTVADNLGHGTSGTFSEDATEPGTYIFANTRITSVVNTARFRITADAIVGAFPFEKPWSNPASYEVVPFIGARAFVTNPAELDGSYNRFGISHNSNGFSDSQILAMRISGHGTVLEMCFNNIIYAIDACPTASKRTYTVTASPDSVWTATGTTPADLLQFRMARIDGENVWLSGGYTDSATDVRVFRVGLRNTPNWPKIRYIGASTEGSWGSNVFDTATSVRRAITPEGGTSDVILPFTSISGPQGIRSLNAAGPKKYFAMQNGVLSVIVGSRNPDTQGYIQVNLFKEALDVRSGRYTVFATNGTEQLLDVDFDTRRYAMTAPGGDTATGPFTEDPNDPGTYIFSNERITTFSNTARFRVTTDAVVGAFPFAIFKSAPVAYAAQPFIAARSFVTNKSELAGLYDVLIASGSSNNSGYMGAYWQLRVNDSGTIATQCSAGTSPCQAPAASPISYDYSIASGASPGIWLLMSSNGAPTFAVRVAKIGSRKILLEAKEFLNISTEPNAPQPAWLLLTGFRQPAPGSVDASWPTLAMHSVSTASTFGTALTDASSYTTQYVQPNGALTTVASTLQSDPTSSQVRVGTDVGGARFLVLQNGAMALMMPMGPAINHLHIGLAN